MLATRVGRYRNWLYKYHPYDEQIFNHGCLVDSSMLRLVDWFLHAADAWLNPTSCGCLIKSYMLRLLSWFRWNPGRQAPR